MRRGVVPVLLVIALVVIVGVAVTALRASGKIIDIRIVDLVTATTTREALSLAPTSAPTGTTEPTTLPTDTQITLPTDAATALATSAATETQPAITVVVVTSTPTAVATTAAVPTGIPTPSVTPVVISGSLSPQPSVSPSGPTPTVTPTLAPGTIVEYSIQPGDTLSGIALQFDTTVEAITARNHIDDPSSILYGFTLQIVVGEQIPPTAQPTSTPGPGTPSVTNTSVAPTATRASTATPAR